PDSIAALQDQFSQVREPLSIVAAENITKELGQRQLSAQTITSALTLHKLGLPMRAPLIRSLDAIRDGNARANQLVRAELQSGVTAIVVDNEAVQSTELSSTIEQAVHGAESLLTQFRMGAESNVADSAVEMGLDETPNESPAEGGEHAGSQHQQSAHYEHLLGLLAINQQTEASSEHRYFVLPLRVGDSVLELNLAMFQEKPNQGNATDVPRRISFAVTLPNLGDVSADAKFLDRKIDISFRSTSQVTLDFLADGMSDLRNSIDANGWQLESIAYELAASTANGESANHAAETVVQHLISQNSLDRRL
ncbi:MAG: flagellar hook-length control protein FliK, partial [Pseudomonadota bacterium]